MIPSQRELAAWTGRHWECYIFLCSIRFGSQIRPEHLPIWFVIWKVGVGFPSTEAGGDHNGFRTLHHWRYVRQSRTAYMIARGSRSWIGQFRSAEFNFRDAVGSVLLLKLQSKCEVQECLAYRMVESVKELYTTELRAWYRGEYTDYTWLSGVVRAVLVPAEATV
jgi:hypothetical protein